MGIDSDYPSFLATSSEPKYLIYENEESFKFPLNIPDNSEPLYAVSKAMRGCFLDSNLLKKAVSTYSRRVSPTSPFASDQKDALQWYTIFLLSSCCPQHTMEEIPVVPPHIELKQKRSIQKITNRKIRIKIIII